MADTQYLDLIGIPAGVQTALNAKAEKPLFAKVTATQNIMSASPVAITELLVSVANNTYYEVELRVLNDVNNSVSQGEISNIGSATFDAALTAMVLDVGGSDARNTSRPVDFTTGGLSNPYLNLGEILIISGIIKTTAAGTIQIAGASINAPDRFSVQALSSLVLRKLA